MEQNTVYNKELYSKSVFYAKRIFQREIVKISENAVVSPKFAFCQVLTISGCSIVGCKQRFAKFKAIFAKKCVLHQIHIWHTTLF